MIRDGKYYILVPMDDAEPIWIEISKQEYERIQAVRAPHTW